MSIQKTFVGTCPEYREKATVTANYKEVKILGKLTTSYKYIGHSCSIGSLKGCSQMLCPLVNKS